LLIPLLVPTRAENNSGKNARTSQKSQDNLMQAYKNSRVCGVFYLQMLGTFPGLQIDMVDHRVFAKFFADIFEFNFCQGSPLRMNEWTRLYHIFL